MVAKKSISQDTVGPWKFPMATPSVCLYKAPSERKYQSLQARVCYLLNHNFERLCTLSELAKSSSLQISTVSERGMLVKSELMSNDANMMLSLCKSELHRPMSFTNWKESFTVNLFTVSGAMAATRNLTRL